VGDDGQLGGGGYRSGAFGVTFRGVVPMRRPSEAAGGEEIAELAALADGTLPADRRAELEARAAESPELTDRLAEQRRAVALARSAAADVEAPARLRAAIEAQRRPARPRTPPRLALAVGSVAVAAAAAVIGFAVIGSGTSAQRFHAALGATELAPGAAGNATLTKTSSGWRIELDAHGLPRLDNGRFYEAWLRNPAGVLVPIGTFNEGRNVTLWAGVSPQDFTLLTVTRERADGDQASSGEKVLAGAVSGG
jgi:anti-sigma-K factor RskA